MRYREQVLADETGVHFITSLPAEAVASAPAPAPTPAPEPAPEQIPASRCQIEFNGVNLSIEPVSGPAPSLNGKPLTGSGRLADGDTLELPDGSAWKLVAVGRDGENGA